MPNWCHNHLYLRGDFADRREFETLNRGHAACYSEPPRQLTLRIVEASTPLFPLSFHSQVPVPASVLAAGFDPAGYDWQVRHWGTKWDLMDDTQVYEEDDDLAYIFETAWSPPIEWLRKVADRFQWLAMEFEYFEPMVGFAGRVLVENGLIYEHTEYTNFEDVAAFGAERFGWEPDADDPNDDEER
jgi:hypothetical protein